MVILGIDPGTLVTGYGVLERVNNRVKVLACDAVTNSRSDAMPHRLRNIFVALTDVIERYRPTQAAIETAFYGKNAQSALKLGQARGVAMLAAVLHNLDISEYSPREVKKAIVGNGTASKEQVQAMMVSLLNMKSTPRHYDVTDALAVGLCHLNRSQTARNSSSTWKSFVQAHPERVRFAGRGGTR